MPPLHPDLEPVAMLLGTCRGEPMEWRITLIRGDRFTFVADWTAGQRNEMRLQMVD